MFDQQQPINNLQSRDLYLIQDNSYFQDYNYMVTSLRLTDNHIKNYIFTKALREIETWLNTKSYSFTILIDQMLNKVPLTLEEQEIKDLKTFLSYMTDKLIRDILNRLSNQQAFDHFTFMYYTDTSITWNVKNLFVKDNVF